MKTGLVVLLTTLLSLKLSAQEGYNFYTSYFAVEGGVIASSAGLALGLGHLLWIGNTL